MTLYVGCDQHKYIQAQILGTGVELLLLVLDIFDGLKTKCSMNVRVCNMKLLTWETGITCAHAICRNHGMEHFKIRFLNLVMQGVFVLILASVEVILYW